MERLDSVLAGALGSPPQPWYGHPVSRPTPATVLLLSWLGATVATLIIFGAGLGADFIQDDYAWLECARDAASDPSHLFTLHISGFWRPLVHLFFLIGSWLFGPSAVAFHLATVALHGLVAALLGRLVVDLTDDLQHGVLTTLLFVILPTHAGVPLWISAVTESIHAAAALLSMIGFVGLIRAPASARRRPFLICLVGFILALAAKETAVVLLPLFALLHLLLTSRLGAKLAPTPRWPFVPLLVLTLLYLGLQLHLQRSSPLIAAGSYSLGLHLLTWIGRGIWELLSAGWPGLAALLLGRLVARRSDDTRATGPRRWIVVAAAAGLVIVPMLPYAPFGGGALASRYLYLPTAAAAALLALALRRLFAGGHAAQLLGLMAALGIAAQGALMTARATQRFRFTADETGAFVRAAARHVAPRLPVRIHGAPLRGQHLAAAMRLFHPTGARCFHYARQGGASPGWTGSIWRWHRLQRRLEVLTVEH